ncbi:EF-P lysine aminoacylase GenX [bacterium]|nr:EF-P lysine aminoacylase GenX [bacterium]
MVRKPGTKAGCKRSPSRATQAHCHDRMRKRFEQYYPSRSGRTHRLDQIGPVTTSGTVSGRLLHFEKRSHDFFGFIEDESGSLVFVFRHGAQPELFSQCKSLETGDFVEITGSLTDSVFYASSIQLLTPSLRGPFLKARELRSLLHMRSLAIKLIRQFFEHNGFLEIDPPLLVAYPNLELHQEPFQTMYRSETGQSRRLYLPSSPEYYLKMALAAGMDKIFALTHSFRNGEYTLFHQPEFLILEWYRAYGSYLDMMTDLEDLLLCLNRELHDSTAFCYKGRTIDLTKPWQRLTVAEAFEKYAGISRDHWEDVELLQKVLGRRISCSSDPFNDWEDHFLAIFLEKIEPELGRGKPLLLYDYPARLAALSKYKDNDPGLAERVELYIEGIELANGYTELNDPHEQHQRFVLDRERKVELGCQKLPIDVDFLKIMEHGMPPAGGIALGLDRLLMLMTDHDDIESIIPFPLKHIPHT